MVDDLSVDEVLSGDIVDSEDEALVGALILILTYSCGFGAESSVCACVDT